MTLTPEQIERIFIVDLEAGRLFWREAPKHRPHLAQKEAGWSHHANGKNYWKITLNGETYRRAYLIYTLANGKGPDAGHIIDHTNGDSLDDRPSNLRQATAVQNAWNHKGRSRRIQLPMGVRVMRGRYQARINFCKTQIHLGVFDTPEAASEAYQIKRKELFGEFA